MKYYLIIVAICMVVLYHTGVASEEACLARGNSAEVCAELRL